MISIGSLRRCFRFRFFLVGVWITSLVAAFLGGAIVFRQRQQIRRLIGTAIRGRVIQSNLYNIAVKTLPIPGEGRDGGISALDDGLLLANRFGAMWFVTAARELRPLSLKIPVNFEEFDHDPYNKDHHSARAVWGKGHSGPTACKRSSSARFAQLLVPRQTLLRASRFECGNNRRRNPQRSRRAPAKLADAV